MALAKSLIRLAKRLPIDLGQGDRSDVTMGKRVAFGFVPVVPDTERGQRAAFEQAARREGRPDYRIIEPDFQGRLVPARPREAYYPIWYAASKSGFEAKFGWDFAADPVLRKAIDKCRDTGDFVVSDMIDLTKVGLQPKFARC